MAYHIKLFVASILAICMTSAFANSASDIKVIGKILSESCNTDGSQLDVDFGLVPFNVNSAGELRLDSKVLKLQVTCSAPTELIVKSIDHNSVGKPTRRISFNYPASYVSGGNPPNNYYGLIDGSGDNSIGAYSLAIRLVVVDGKAVPFMDSPDGKIWRKPYTPSIIPVKLDTNYPYLTPAISEVPNSLLQGRHFDFNIHLGATLLRDLLPPDLQNVNIAGSSSFEISYL